MNMKKENRFCNKQQEYCIFANRCLHCEYYDDFLKLCGRNYYLGKYY